MILWPASTGNIHTDGLNVILHSELTSLKSVLQSLVTHLSNPPGFKWASISDQTSLLLHADERYVGGADTPTSL